MVTNLILFFVFFLASSFPGDRSSFRALDQAVRDAARQDILRQGQWSCTILDAKDNAPLIEYNYQRSLSPASNMKLITSAAALNLLGPDMRLNTYLEYNGAIGPDGVLNGDLFIRGEGDPTLGSGEIDGVLSLDSLMIEWVGAVHRIGITAIRGRIISDDSYLDHMPLPGNWFWTDMGNYYAAGTSGLCINENLYRLYFKPGKRVGDPAQVLHTEPVVPDLTFFNHMKTGPVGSGDNGYIYAAPWQYLHQLEGTVPAGVDQFSIKGALPDPALFAAQYFREKLTEEGITVSGGAHTIRDKAPFEKPHTVIHTTTSPPLSKIVYRLNKRSVNIYAEQLLKIIAKKTDSGNSFEAGLERIDDWLNDAGITTSGIFIHDGSGLSRSNAVSTRFFAELLAYMSRQSEFNDYYNSLGIAGDASDIGYMKFFARGTAAAHNLRAKTGTLERIRAHSGYVHTKSGKLLTFSMIANDFRGSSRNIDNFHERIMVKMAELP